jgi:hypothetical protein
MHFKAPVMRVISSRLRFGCRKSWRPLTSRNQTLVTHSGEETAPP